ncbi:MAG: hypothetical protein AAGC74_04880 [Verrucomicrobiota bacterium]
MNNMPQKGIIAGAILIAIALIGYFASGMKSPTAFIPAAPGIFILGFSLLAKKEKFLKLGMHVAALFGLLGFLAPLGRIIPTIAKGTFEFNFAAVALFAMLITCGIFLFQCIQSFKAARRAKKDAAS